MLCNFRSLLTFDATPPVARLYPIAAPNANGLDGIPIRVRLEPHAVFAAKVERPIDGDDVAVPIAHFKATVLGWISRIWARGDWNRIELTSADE